MRADRPVIDIYCDDVHVTFQCTIKGVRGEADERRSLTKV